MQREDDATHVLLEGFSLALHQGSSADPQVQFCVISHGAVFTFLNEKYPVSLSFN